MNLQTPLHIPILKTPIGYEHRLLAMGSCFAETMGQRLAQNKFDILTNPLGIAYNPLSLFKLIRIGLGREELHLESHQHLGHAFSFDLHGKWTAPDLSALREKLAPVQESLRKRLQRLDFLILTFGTAHVYVQKITSQRVNNCHKYPSDYFYRNMLDPQLIAKDFGDLLSVLQALNPALQVILTVSPIRHIRDGLSVNSLSKSILRYSCALMEEGKQAVHYFPSFEVMMDELRDYRFYGEDLIHPNSTGEAVIWEKFQSSCLSAESRERMKAWAKVRLKMEHRPLHPWSEDYFSFLEKLKVKLENLAKMGFDVSDEEKKLDQRIDHWHSEYGTRQKK